MSIQDLAHALFGSEDYAAAAGALAAAAATTDLRTRVHIFFRNVEGVWACCDPDCPSVSSDYRSSGRRIGRLYARPRYRCTCGARVLQLLYCQNCGDTLLGGFSTPNPGAAIERYLLPDLPDLDLLPERARLSATAANYVVYWPQRGAPQSIQKTNPTRSADQGGEYEFSFRPARLYPGLGLTHAGHREPTGWVYHITPKRGAKLDVIPPYPLWCPNCGDSWERKYGRLLRDRLQSPIRGMRTGFEKITQVLVGDLQRSLGAGEGPAQKMVVFSDSRQDAAKLSIGLEKRHYQDTVRLLIVSELQSQAGRSADLRILEEYLQGARSSRHQDVYRRLRDADRDGVQALLAVVGGHADDDDKRAAAAYRARLESSSVPFDQFEQAVSRALLERGINPGGPDYSLQTYSLGRRQRRQPWTDLYDWDSIPPKDRQHLGEEAKELRGID